MVFPAELSDALALVLANCKGANAHLTAENPGHPNDVQDVRAVQAAMASFGVSPTYGEAYNLWGSVHMDADTCTIIKRALVQIGGLNLLHYPAQKSGDR